MRLTRLILILSTSVLLGGCSLLGGKSRYPDHRQSPGQCFLDNKSLGQTPVYQEGLKPGTYTLKIAASDQTLSAWEGKITLNAGALTVIDRQLTADPAKSFGYTLAFEVLTNKTATEVNLVSFLIPSRLWSTALRLVLRPSRATLSPPAAISSLSPRLVIKIKSSRLRSGPATVSSSMFSSVPKPSFPLRPPTPNATPSATPTLGTIEITPLPKQASSAAVLKPYAEILSTPTGFLRVRDSASTSGTEVAKVNPGDKFPYLATEGAWYQIEYLTGKKGLRQRHLRKIDPIINWRRHNKSSQLPKPPNHRRN